MRGIRGAIRTSPRPAVAAARCRRPQTPGSAASSGIRRVRDSCICSRCSTARPRARVPRVGAAPLRRARGRPRAPCRVSPRPAGRCAQRCRRCRSAARRPGRPALARSAWCPAPWAAGRRLRRRLGHRVGGALGFCFADCPLVGFI